MKNTVYISLLLLIITSFVSCADDDIKKAETIVGTWTLNAYDAKVDANGVDVSSTIKQAVKDAYPCVGAVYVFAEDNTVTLYPDGDQDPYNSVEGTYRYKNNLLEISLGEVQCSYMITLKDDVLRAEEDMTPFYSSSVGWNHLPDDAVISKVVKVHNMIRK